MCLSIQVWCKLSHHHHWPPSSQPNNGFIDPVCCVCMCICCVPDFAFCSLLYPKVKHLLYKHLFKQHTQTHTNTRAPTNHQAANAILRNHRAAAAQHAALELLECGLGFFWYYFIILSCVCIDCLAAFNRRAPRVGHLKVRAHATRVLYEKPITRAPHSGTHNETCVRADGAGECCSRANVHCACSMRSVRSV